MRNTQSIYDLSFSDISNLVDGWSEPAYRAMQLWKGLYCQLWVSYNDFSNLPKSIREKLFNYTQLGDAIASEVPSFARLIPIKQQKSKDEQTIKTLFSLPNGNQVEAVLMRYATRRTLCISTQSGCAMGCVFCATGQMGFKRNLSSSEIIEQVIYYARQLANEGERVTNVVFMGMGEPFHNYDATMEAINRLNDSQGYNLGSRRFTVSTVGIIPKIHQFAQENTQVNLAISLHAADDDLRTKLLPVNKKYPINQLLDACRDYVQKTHRRISFEWALIDNVNDSIEQAEVLSQRLQTFRFNDINLSHVNLIPLNPTYNYRGRASTPQKALAFKSALERAGIQCTIRLRRGIEIQAGCGQLASNDKQ